MAPAQLLVLTTLAMVAFAGNSLLCRAALAGTAIDAASFTLLRVLAGAVTLLFIDVAKRRSFSVGGSWPSGLALFIYAAGFSFAYIGLSAGTGALLLFGAVQITMIAYGVAFNHERLHPLQMAGMGLAFLGLVGLILPGLAAPPLGSAVLMLLAGVAWGAYSLLGRKGGEPIRMSAGNFLRAVPLTLVVLFLFREKIVVDGAGALLAVASGALASGVGYAMWYSVLPKLAATTAATVQLSVPVLAAFGGVMLLSEALTLRLVWTSVAILGGIALFIRYRLVKA